MAYSVSMPYACADAHVCLCSGFEYGLLCDDAFRRCRRSFVSFLVLSMGYFVPMPSAGADARVYPFSGFEYGLLCIDAPTLACVISLVLSMGYCFDDLRLCVCLSSGSECSPLYVDTHLFRRLPPVSVSFLGLSTGPLCIDAYL